MERLWCKYENGNLIVLAARGYDAIAIGTVLNPLTDTDGLNISVDSPPPADGPFSDGIRYA